MCDAEKCEAVTREFFFDPDSLKVFSVRNELGLSFDPMKQKLTRKTSFAQSVRIELASPHAAWISIFKGNSVVLHLHEGPD